jgi:hypothetical protein
MARSRNTADTQTASGGPVSPFVVGKNKLINGDFSINQRAFSSVTANVTFTFDRWKTDISGTTTCTPQAFTPGAAPVSGYEGANYLQIVTSGHTGTNGAGVYNRMEDVRTLAGQTATVSFWAKAASGTPSVLVNLAQLFGSGGSSTVIVSPSTPSTATAITTSWARYSFVFNVPSLSGKTIGTNNSLQIEIGVSDGGFLGLVPSLGVQNNTFSIWGVQVEAGPVATPFQTATGTIQGELAACQRYYNVIASGASKFISPCYGYSTSRVDGVINFPYMRTAPTLVVASGTNWYVNAGPTGGSFNSFTGYYASNSCIGWYSGTSTTQALGYGGGCYTNNASASVALDAEL